MDRRSALARLAAMTGGLVLGADAFLAGCRLPGKHRSTEFTPADVAFMDEIGETIVPATDSPGAKAAGIGAFMARMINDCYDDEAHQAFVDGLTTIDDESRRRFDRPFMQCSPADRTRLLTDVDREAREAQRTRKAGEAPHYFRMMRELALLGYFTSEIGATQAMRYVETPGRFDGDVPYQRGDGAWVNPMKRFG